MKYFCFLLYSRLENGVPMVTKLVLEIHALCNKNEISYAEDVTLLIMDLPLRFQCEGSICSENCDIMFVCLFVCLFFSLSLIYINHCFFHRIFLF